MFIALISVLLRMPGLKEKSLVVITRLVDNGGLVKIYTMAKLIRVAMISTKFIRFSFDKLARTHKIARSFTPRVLVPKPVLTGSAYVTHAPQEPHFGSDTLPLFDTRKWSKYNHTAPCLYNSNSFKEF